MTVMLEPFHATVQDGVLRLEAQVPLVASHAAAQRGFLKEHLARAERAVELDLAGSELVDSLGITLIVGLFKSCGERKLGFSVSGASAEAARLFKFFGLDQVFTIREK